MPNVAAVRPTQTPNWVNMVAQALPTVAETVGGAIGTYFGGPLGTAIGAGVGGLGGYAAEQLIEGGNATYGGGNAYSNNPMLPSTQLP